MALDIHHLSNGDDVAMSRDIISMQVESFLSEGIICVDPSGHWQTLHVLPE
jgi:hypothetical protein